MCELYGKRSGLRGSCNRGLRSALLQHCFARRACCISGCGCRTLRRLRNRLLPFRKIGEARNVVCSCSRIRPRLARGLSLCTGGAGKGKGQLVAALVPVCVLCLRLSLHDAGVLVEIFSPHAPDFFPPTVAFLLRSEPLWLTHACARSLFLICHAVLRRTPSSCSGY